MPIVELSNGQEVEFPDGMSKEQIHAALQKHFPAENNRKKNSESNNKPQWERFLESQDENPMEHLEPFGGGGNAQRQAALQTAAFAIPQARLASKLAPGAGKIAESLLNYGGAIGQNAATSGLLNFSEGNSTKEGAIHGGATAAALIPGMHSIEKSFNAFRPQKMTKEIINHLSGGDSLPKNVKILANRIKERGQLAKKEAKELYDPIFKHPSVHSGSIYSEVNPSGIHAYVEKPEYELPQNVSGQLKRAFNKFESNSTAKNAHFLQSELSLESRGTLDRVLKNNLLNIQSNIKKDLFSYFKKQNPAILADYKLATKSYKENVGPYLDNPKIRKIMNSANPNLNTVLNIFKNPNEGAEKIANDIGESGMNRILAGVLKTDKKISSDQLLKNYSKLEQHGFSDYISPTTKKLFESLARKEKRKEFITRGAGALAASQVGKAMGIPGGELIGAIAGGMKGPAVAKNINSKISIPLSKKHLIEALSKAYRLGSWGNQ